MKRMKREAYWEFKKRLRQEIRGFLTSYTQNFLNGDNTPMLNPYPERVWEVLCKYDINLKGESSDDLMEKLNGQWVYVEIDVIEVHDGFIYIPLKNAEFDDRWGWNEFIKYNEEISLYSEECSWEYEMKELFAKERVHFLNELRKDLKIGIMTHVSSKTFFEAVEPILSTTNKVIVDKWFYGYNIKQIYNSKRIPLSFFLDIDNLFSNVSKYRLDEILSSDLYVIPDTIKQEFNRLINGISNKDEMEIVFDEITENEVRIREVTRYYLDRVHIPWLYSDYIHKNPDRYKVLRFYENFSRFSDRINYGCWEDRPGESSIDYVVIDYSSEQIIMCPCNSKYSVYTFGFFPKYCNIETAAIAVIMYYSSHLCNKRQGSGVPKILQHFGITALWKSRW